MKQNEFQEKIEHQLIRFKEEIQFLPSTNKKKPWQYFDISDNLYPPIKHSFLQYVYDHAVPLHDYVNHVRSSQVFGINLLFPLLSDVKGSGKTVLIDLLNRKLNLKILKIDDFQFEFSPDEDWLGEWPGKEKPSEYMTSVDVLLRCSEATRSLVFLLEIKFTEQEFGPCNGITSRGCTTKDKHCCMNFGEVLENTENCFLHKKHKSRSARKYFDYFDLKKEFELKKKECPFIDNNQCLRNHALARAIKKHENIDEVYFGLICYDTNHLIQKRWAEYVDLVPSSTELFSLSPAEIVNDYGIHNTNYKMYFNKRYGL